MKKNKFLSLLQVLVAIAIIALFTLPAAADVGSKSFGITNSIVNNATVTSAVNVGTVVKIDDRETASFVFKAAGSTAQSGNISFTFVRSADNSTWETTPGFIWVVPLNSLTPVVAWTNFPREVIGSAGYVKCIGITNANSTALATNAALYLIDKKVR